MTGKYSLFIFLMVLTILVFNSLDGQGAMAGDNSFVYTQYNLSVSFDLKENLIRGEVKIALSGPTEISLEGFRITDIRFDGKPFSAQSAQNLLRIERKGLPALALTTDSSVVTAIANDYGYDRVFERQVEANANKGDERMLIISQ